MKKIFYLFVILSLTACVASKWHDENDTRSVLGKIVDSKYDPKYDNLVVENLNTYWNVYLTPNGNISIAKGDMVLSIPRIPFNQNDLTCKEYPLGSEFELNFLKSMMMSYYGAPNILYSPEKTFIITNKQQIKLTSNKQRIFSVWKNNSKYPFDNSFIFITPCEHRIKNNTIIHIGGIYEDGKELPPIEFKIFKKTDGQ